jgi:hypothetical protein
MRHFGKEDPILKDGQVKRLVLLPYTEPVQFEADVEPFAFQPVVLRVSGRHFK